MYCNLCYIVSISTYILSHSQIIFSEEGTVHGINLYYYKNQHSLFSNVSETPSNVAYYAFDFKYGMINLTAVMPAGKYYSVIILCICNISHLRSKGKTSA